MATDQIKYDGAVELYIHLHPSYFTYIVFSTTSSTFIDFDVELHDGRKVIHNKQLEEWLKKKELIFNHSFKKINVCVNTSSFSILDNEALVSADNFKILNDFNDSTETICLNKFDKNLIIQYSIKKAVYNLLLGYFKKEAIHFGDTGLINASLKSKLNNAVFCQVLGEEVSIAVKKDKELALFNKYTFKNNEDLLYYILLCYQSNKLDTNETILSLSGLIEIHSPMYELVFDYVKNVKLEKSLEPIQINDSISSRINHYYFNLLNIRL